MKKLPTIVLNVGLVLAASGVAVRYGVAACDSPPAHQAQAQSRSSGAPAQTQTPKDMDSLLAPIALYPDQLLAQILLCAGDPASVRKLSDWLFANQTLKGTELQDAAVVAGFEPSFVALAVFPQVVNSMAEKIEWTTLVGQLFAADRTAVFASIQKLRAQARDVGTLKSTPQQQVETKTTSSGQNVIVIEPTNPQVVYVPQYNPTVVYTQPPTTTVVVQESSSSSDAVAAGLIGFTAGIAIGAAVNNNYYYGPYGFYGGAYMYNDAWDDYYDHREDAREDWQDHREDLAEERGDRAKNGQEQRTDRQQNRQENRPETTQAQRDQRRSEAQAQGAQRRTDAQTAATSGTQSKSSRGSGSYESRGYSSSQSAGTQRSGTKSDAFSGYSSGRSERAASSRGQQSRSSSRSRGGGGRRR
jgi:uncharacterized protein DUF3300